MDENTVRLTFQCVEIVLTILAVAIITISTFVIIRIRLFHVNLNIILLNLVLQFYIHALVVFFFFWGQYLGSAPTKATIQLLNCIRWTAMTGAALIKPSMVAERAAACLFIRSYERTKRLYIPLLILCIQWSGSTYLNYQAFFKTANMFPHLVSIGFANGTSLVTFAFVWLWTKHRRSLINQTTYSLSERFQLAENYRACRIIQWAILSAGAATGVILCLFIASALMREVAKNTTMATGLELAAYSTMPLCAIALSILPFMWQEQWRREIRLFFRLLPSFLILLHILSKAPGTATRSPVMEMTKIDLTHQQAPKLKSTDGKQMNFGAFEEQKICFDYLQRTWK